MDYDLVEVTDPADWLAYHAIRRQELFEGKGRHGIYDENYPGERAPNMHHYLLKRGGEPLGTTRLELRDGATAIFRLVAITAAAQGQGHGRVLGQMVEERAKAFGITMLLVNAAPEAVGFYEKTGWHAHEWDREELTGIAATCVQMRKPL